MKHNGDMDKKPRGLHAVVPATDELPEGVIFVLKNVNNSVNVDNRNRIHPFYMVYISTDGEIICDYLNPKKLLDDVRLLCRGKPKPISEVYERFNRETDDGRNMAGMSELLSEAGLTLDAMYENLIRQIAGKNLGGEENFTLKESIEQQKQREQLEKQIAALEAKIKKEKQPKKKFGLVSKLKQLRDDAKKLGGR